MKHTKISKILTMLFAVVLCFGPVGLTVEPVGTAFTYQGRLIAANKTADGLYDFQFKLWDANSDGNKLGTDINKPQVDVIDGYFTVELDFNDTNAFNGNVRWLEIGVRPGIQSDPNAYTPLTPRQKITAAPYALYTRNGGGTGNWQVNGSSIYYNNGNVGIGTTNPEKKLHVVGSIKIVDGHQGVNKVLTSDSNGTASWQNIPIYPGGVPSGIIVMWSGSITNIPAGWALCDGNNGTPDLRDRFIVGAGNEYSVGDIGGEKTHTLTVDEMPSHTHAGRFADQRDDSSGDDTTYYVNKGGDGASGATGGNQPHENRPPYYALAYIMKL